MGEPATSLSVTDLDVSVAGRTLVKALNLHLHSGETLAILGQNGSGKTLTLHTLAGLRDLSGGSISLFGQAMATSSRRHIARLLALLPQTSEDVFPSTVFDTALIGRHPHIEPLRLESADDRRIAECCLADVDLAGLADRDLTTLSGGERRRLAIAQCLAQTPRIFVLDEPLNHLDPQHQLDVLDLFAARAREGATVVAALHDVNLAMRYADRCLLLFGDGRWVLGEARDVLTETHLSELFNVRMESLAWKDLRLFVAVGARGESGHEAAQSFEQNGV